MSDNSTTTTLQLDEERQLLEISDSLVDCTVLFTVQTENSIPFDFAIVDRRTLDENDFNYNKVDNGYVSGTAKNINKPTFMVLRADQPCKAEITLQRTGMKKRQTSKTSTIASVNRKSSSASGDAPKPKFYKNKWFLISIGVVVLVGAIYIIKRRRSSKNSTAPKPPASSLLSNDPVSNETSSQSFGF
jgi:hypothetical protein